MIKNLTHLIFVSWDRHFEEKYNVSHWWVIKFLVATLKTDKTDEINHSNVLFNHKESQVASFQDVINIKKIVTRKFSFLFSKEASKI